MLQLGFKLQIINQLFEDGYNISIIYSLGKGKQVKMMIDDIKQQVQLIKNTKYLNQSFYKINVSLNPNDECGSCNGWMHIVSQTNQNVDKLCAKYNMLLESATSMMKGFMNILQQTNNDIMHINKELQEQRSMVREMKDEHKIILQDNEKAMGELRIMLVNKDEEIAELRQELEKSQSFIEQIKSQVLQIRKEGEQQLKQSTQSYAIEHEQVIEELQRIINQINYKNSQLNSYNNQLQYRVYELQQEIKVMEKDLTQNNIKSARIIKQPTLQLNQQSNSKSQPSSIVSKRTQTQNRTSFIGQGFALKDVLDISRQSNYFNLTRKKLNPPISTQKHIYNQENDQNILNTRNDKESKVITEFKEFDVSQQQNKASQGQKKADPYHSFFLLTIQCIKLNSNRMDEVANVNLEGEWTHLLSNNIPMNLWQSHLEQKLKQKLI